MRVPGLPSTSASRQSPSGEGDWRFCRGVLLTSRSVSLSFRTCDAQLPPPTLSPLNAEGFVVFEFLHQFS